MTSSDLTPLSEIPDAVMSDVLYHVATFTIGFLRPAGHDPRDTELLGTGTIVKAGQVRAILTAHHVVEKLPKRGRVRVAILDRSHQVTSLDASALQVSFEDRGSIAAEGPDIAIVTIAPDVASSIAATKTFYNLDLSRETVMTNPPDIVDGVWVVQGFVGQWTAVDRASDGRIVSKAFFHFSGSGATESERCIGQYAYVDFPIVPHDNPSVPTSFGGMSGGGLWQVPLRRNADGAIKNDRPLLSGVIFYQYTENEQRHIKCHFRRSVYGQVLENLTRPGAELHR